MGYLINTFLPPENQREPNVGIQKFNKLKEYKGGVLDARSLGRMNMMKVGDKMGTMIASSSKEPRKPFGKMKGDFHQDESISIKTLRKMISKAHERLLELEAQAGIPRVYNEPPLQGNYRRYVPSPPPDADENQDDGNSRSSGGALGDSANAPMGSNRPTRPNMNEEARAELQQVENQGNLLVFNKDGNRVDQVRQNFNNATGSTIQFEKFNPNLFIQLALQNPFRNYILARIHSGRGGLELLSIRNQGALPPNVVDDFMDMLRDELNDIQDPNILFL